MDIGSLLGGAKSYIFGPGTDAPTYESLRKKREIIDLLSQQAVGGEYRNWGDGVGGIMKALGARIMDNKLAPKEDEHRKAIADAIAGITGGGVAGAPGGFTGQGFSGTPETLGGGGYRDAIASIESAGSGDYAAMGPVTKSGDRAYGKYQVMGANIPEWTKEALGQSLTPEQFAQNPQAQDATFDHRFGGYADKYGPEGAASMWFSGDPTPDGSADQLGTSDTDYVQKFMQSLGGGGGMGGMGGGEPDMGRVGQLAEMMSDPYVTPGQQMVIKALIERELDQGGGGMTAYQAAQLGLDKERLGLDREKMEAGTREGVQSFGNVNWALRDNPATPENDPIPTPWTSNKKGEVQWYDLGGAQGLPPTRSADTGTEIIPVGPGGLPTGQTIKKDVAGAAAQGEVGKAAGTAAAGLGEKELAVTAAIEHAERVITNPNLPDVTGGLWGRLPANPLNQDDTNLVEDIKGLGGKVFSNAIDALRGLGAMTEAEGQAARDALANLSRIQDDKQLAAELQRFQEMLKGKLEVARQKARTVTGGGAEKWVGKDTRTLSPEELDEMIRDLQAGQ
jgi:hypothetical protein